MKFRNLVKRTFQFEMRVDSDARKWKKLVEILPAAEILYMQYVTLKNEEANAFIESVSKN